MWVFLAVCCCFFAHVRHQRRGPVSREAGREKETSMTTIVRVSPTEELQETDQALIQAAYTLPAGGCSVCKAQTQCSGFRCSDAGGWCCSGAGVSVNAGMVGRGCCYRGDASLYIHMLTIKCKNNFPCCLNYKNCSQKQLVLNAPVSCNSSLKLSLPDAFLRRDTLTLKLSSSRIWRSDSLWVITPGHSSTLLLLVQCIRKNKPAAAAAAAYYHSGPDVGSLCLSGFRCFELTWVQSLRLVHLSSCNKQTAPGSGGSSSTVSWRSRSSSFVCGFQMGFCSHLLRSLLCSFMFQARQECKK